MNLILQKRRCPSRQRRAGNFNNGNGGEYTYESGTNKLKSVASGMGGSADSRNMSAAENFDYDTEGNLISDLSKNMKIFYDWRSMPTEFKRVNFCYDIHETTACDSTKLLMAYDGSGRRVSKTQLHTSGNGVWDTVLVTHYTGMGTEVRENFEGPAPETKVVVNMPQGLGRYGIEDADHTAENGSAQTFEWYLKNHLGSTMLVYGTRASSSTGGVKAAYDYRSFGEQIELTPPSTGKVTENFTGKERDDEIELDYFGARYLDPMLGMWTSVDPARQFASPYLYAGNGMNPIIGADDDGRYFIHENSWGTFEIRTFSMTNAVVGNGVKSGAVLGGALYGTFTSGTAATLATAGSILYSIGTGFIDEYNSEKGITGRYFVRDLLTDPVGFLTGLVDKFAGKVSGSLTAGAVFLTDLYNSFDKVDSPEFIDEFNSRMKSNGGDYWNSFNSREEAEAFANGILKDIEERNK